MPQVASVASECHSKPFPIVIQAAAYKTKIAKAAGRAVSTPICVSQPRIFLRTISGNTVKEPKVPDHPLKLMTR